MSIDELDETDIHLLESDGKLTRNIHNEPTLSLSQNVMKLCNHLLPLCQCIEKWH